MCIPIFFVCGDQELVKPLGASRFCANCGTKDGARLYESYTKFHFCFVPLCKSSQPRHFYRCATCGASYPAQINTGAPAPAPAAPATAPVAAPPPRK